MAETVFLCLGSNLGDRKANLEAALSALSGKCRLVKKSSVYETSPVGFTGQPDFLNIVAEVVTSLPPSELLSFTQSVERLAGRKKTFRWGPRLLDIDIIFYGQRTVREPRLVIPHERMHERRFVLVPLAEIAPGFTSPGTGKTVEAMLRELGPSTTDSVVIYKGK